MRGRGRRRPAALRGGRARHPRRGQRGRRALPGVIPDAADWAVGFYEGHGFENLGPSPELLDAYWDVPDHQVEASVVLRYER